MAGWHMADSGGHVFEPSSGVGGAQSPERAAVHEVPESRARLGN